MDSPHFFYLVSPPNELHLAISKGRYRKGIISVGKFIQPDGSFTLNVTPKRMQKWVDTFNQLKSKGVRIPVTDSHEYEKNENTMGYLDELYIEHNWLMGIMTLRGDKAIDTAERVGQVSIGIISEFADGVGGVYEDAVNHVAIVNDPLVPGQDDFEEIEFDEPQRIAANKCVMLSLRSSNDIKEIKTTMNKSFIQQLQEMTGDSTLTKENALERLEAKFIEVEELKLSKDKLKQYEATAIPKNDPEVIEDRAQLYSDKIDALVEATKITPELGKELKLSLIGDASKRNVMALSSGGNRSMPFAKEIIQLLEKLPNQIALGTKSGAQVAVLADDGRRGKFTVSADRIEAAARHTGLSKEQKEAALQASKKFASISNN